MNDSNIPSWILDILASLIAKDKKTFPSTSLQSLSVELLFWQPFEPCRADFLRHGAADGAPNSPKWHRWKLPNWAKLFTIDLLNSFVRDVQQTWILHDIKKTWCNAAEIPWFLPGDHPGDGLPWLLSIVASADQVQSGEFTDSSLGWNSHQPLRSKCKWNHSCKKWVGDLLLWIPFVTCIC